MMGGLREEDFNMARVFREHRWWQIALLAWCLGISTSLGAVVWAPPISAVTPDEVRLPEGCSLNEVYELVQGFLAAINAGDVASLRQYLPDHDGEPTLPDPNAFAWYTVTADDPGDFSTVHLAELYAYIQQRHRQHERLTLQALWVNRTEQPSIEAGVTYDLLRTADDIPSAVLTNGKGGINCATGTVFLWGMGTADWRPPTATPVSLPTPSPVLAPEIVLLHALRQHGLIPVSTTAVAPSVEAMFPAAASCVLVNLYGPLPAEPATVLIIRPVPDHARGTPPAGPEADMLPADHWYIGADLAVWYAGGDPVVQRLLTEVIRRDG
jgi:hypothetical protein